MNTQRSTVSLYSTCQIPILSCPSSVNLPALLYQTDTKRKPDSEEKMESVLTNEWVRFLFCGSLLYRLVLRARRSFTLYNFSKIPPHPPKSSSSSHSSVLSHPHSAAGGTTSTVMSLCGFRPPVPVTPVTDHFSYDLYLGVRRPALST